MSLTKKLTRKLYKTEKMTSIAQLEKDFGDFPPYPLTCSGVDSKFYITRIARALNTPTRLRQMYQLLRRKEADLAQTHESATMETRALIDSIIRMQSIKHKTMADFRELGYIKRALLVLILVLISPVLFFTLIIGTTIIIKKPSTGKVYGWHLPLSNEVVLIKDSSSTSQYNPALVSHEHLHYLQDLNRESLPRVSRSILHPESHLDNYGKAQNFIIYLLFQNEVEARLHEIVLSYYRHYGELPTNYKSFLLLLEQCEEMSNIVSELSQLYDKTYQLEEGSEYSARDPEMARQLYSCILTFSDLNATFRFITEVLPMMYGNLIFYYGDEDASKSFINQIPDTSFYFELYGRDGAADTDTGISTNAH